MVIVASLLEAEARPKDFAKVARVIYNRLDAGMRLQLDATVNYALERHRPPAQQRRPRGRRRPTTPTSTKGCPRVRSTARARRPSRPRWPPRRGPWLYYVTVNPETGKTKFTDSYEEFLQFKAEFQATQ